MTSSARSSFPWATVGGTRLAFGRARSRTGRALVVLVVYTVAVLAFFIAGVGPASFRNGLADATPLPLGVTATIAAAVAVRRSRGRSTLWRPWAYATLAYACWLAGDVQWLIYRDFAGISPFPSPADVTYLAFYMFMLAALITFPGHPLNGDARIRFWLDAGIVVVGGGMVIGAVVLSPTIAAGAPTPIELALATAYPVGDLVLLLGVAKAGLQRGDGRSGLPLAILLVGVLCALCADVIFTTETLNGTFVGGGVADDLYHVMWACFAAAAIVQLDREPTYAQDEHGAGDNPGLNPLPLLAILVGFGLLTATEGLDFSTVAGQILAGTLVLTTLVSVRLVTVIVQQRAAARDLRQSEARLRASEAAKSTFLATMSHEIRTPMNAVIGMSELLLATELAPDQRESAELIATSGRSLLALINDILDFSRIESGRLELESTAFEPRQLTQEVVAIFAQPATEKGIVLRSSVASDVPDVLRGDPTRLRQVLANLVGNAVKFTQKGSVDLLVRRATEVDGRGDQPDPGAENSTAESAATNLSFAVADTGIGIAPEAIEGLFTPFTQADASTTRRFGGTGLGLAICRSIVEAMGGEIDVTSTAGVGSTFRVIAPFAPATRDELPVSADQRTAEVAFPGARVLVAEDNVANKRVIVRMLERLLIDPTVASDGAAALEALSNDTFDLVLMDCHMPILDGFAATAVIRSLADERARLPIVALTADAFTGDRETCLAAGMDDYLAKPIESRALAAVLSRHLAAFRVDVAPMCGVRRARCWSASEEQCCGTSGDLIDATAIEKLRALDPDGSLGFLDGMIADFGAVARETMPRLQEAAATGDPGELEEHAHKLKGCAANLGATKIAQLAAELVALARTNSTDGAAALASDLEREIALAIAALDALGENDRGTRAPEAA